MFFCAILPAKDKKAMEKTINNKRKISKPSPKRPGIDSLIKAVS